MKVYLVYIIEQFQIINNWIAFIVLIIFTLGYVAFFTIAERKLMGSIQRRKGPDVVGFWGTFQAFADGMKLLFKEILLPYRVTLTIFMIGPSLVFFLSLVGWVVFPYNEKKIFSLINFSLLYVIISTGFNIYGLLLSGWSSNSRYAFLGGIRAVAQMISYELILALVNVIIIFLSGSINYSDIIYTQQKTLWFIIPLFPIFLIYLIVMLAETNRTPFDLAEAEAELVAGYNVEYSSIIFALFFLGEYTNMIFLSINAVLFFFGGWDLPLNLGVVLSAEIIFILKILFFCIFFIWIRATLPRYRYDQLMELCWKIILPFLFSFFLFLILYIFWFSVTFNDAFVTILLIKKNLFKTLNLLIYYLYCYYYSLYPNEYLWLHADILTKSSIDYILFLKLNQSYYGIAQTLFRQTQWKTYFMYMNNQEQLWYQEMYRRYAYYEYYYYLRRALFLAKIELKKPNFKFLEKHLMLILQTEIQKYNKNYLKNIHQIPDMSFFRNYFSTIISGPIKTKIFSSYNTIVPGHYIINTIIKIYNMYLPPQRMGLPCYMLDWLAYYERIVLNMQKNNLYLLKKYLLHSLNYTPASSGISLKNGYTYKYMKNFNEITENFFYNSYKHKYYSRLHPITLLHDNIFAKPPFESISSLESNIRKYAKN